MIIDNLPVLSGAVRQNMEIPIESGTNTYKTTVEELLLPSGLLAIYCGTVSALPTTFNTFEALSVTSDMIVVAAQFGTPSAVTWPWHFNTTDGAITISVESGAPSGNTGISGSTTLTLYLQKIQNT